jgi:hypothetical protein
MGFGTVKWSVAVPDTTPVGAKTSGPVAAPPPAQASTTAAGQRLSYNQNLWIDHPFGAPAYPPSLTKTRFAGGGTPRTRDTPALTVVTLDDATAVDAALALDEIVREGARRMLMAAWKPRSPTTSAR